ncbi:hypothetical protein [Halalkalicoccus sp. NIPERK01]|uniref:hypothetical protein n=1 Tax=Halalkalicoccus sp. NIPERK01 TaxID=3053469 RepID=UPI00256F2C60|nr:hypothetical protein [Halalkalicoccus sp. NIPERK01]MDL5361226.1 hypothetical protein [Halalkalicoccus sp. NIPERK01]
MRVFDPDEILINVIPGGLVVFTFFYLTGDVEYITSISVLAIGIFVVVSFLLMELPTKISNQPSWYPQLFTSTVTLSRDPAKAEEELNREPTLASKMLEFRAVDRINLTKTKKEFWSIAKVSMS